MSNKQIKQLIEYIKTHTVFFNEGNNVYKLVIFVQMDYKGHPTDTYVEPVAWLGTQSTEDSKKYARECVSLWCSEPEDFYISAGRLSLQ